MYIVLSYAYFPPKKKVSLIGILYHAFTQRWILAFCCNLFTHKFKSHSLHHLNYQVFENVGILRNYFGWCKQEWQIENKWNIQLVQK
jgi:hypothetical protein